MFSQSGFSNESSGKRILLDNAIKVTLDKVYYCKFYC